MTDDASSPVEPAGPEADEAILDALSRVLAGTALRGSPRSRALLSFVVTETLAGRGERLSARVVGGEPAQSGEGSGGRDEDRVRVQATRLRKALAAYYSGEGAADPVRIDLPPGGYTPTFTVAPAPVPSDAPIPMAVLVMAFDSAGTGADAVATVVSEALVAQLARFPGLRVLGPGTARSVDARQIGRGMGARYVVQGSAVRHGDGMRLSARVTDAATGEIVWAVADTLAPGPEQLEPLVDGWVAEAAGELGDYAGVLLPRSVGRPGDVGVETRARLAFYTYILHGTNASLRDARSALDEAVAAGARSPDVLGMAANCLAMLALYGLSPDRDADLAEAERLARLAIAEDPRASAHAHLALGQVALARRQWSVAVECARQGARQATGHPTMLATAGVLLCLAGAWEDGVAVTREALRLNAAHPRYMHGPLAVDRIFAGDDAAGLAEAALMTSVDTYHGPFWRAIALAGLGYLDRARLEYAAAVAAEPGLADDPRSVVTGYGYMHPEHLALVLDRVSLIREGSASHGGDAAAPA